VKLKPVKVWFVRVKVTSAEAADTRAAAATPAARTVFIDLSDEKMGGTEGTGDEGRGTRDRNSKGPRTQELRRRMTSPTGQMKATQKISKGTGFKGEGLRGKA
jgi:hypothetical protein